MRRIIFLFVIVLAYHGQVNADTIYLKKGGTRAGVTVIQETYQAIIYRVDDKEDKLRADLVDWVEYSDASQNFINGKNAQQKGKAEDAVGLLKEALEAAKKPPVVGSWI